MAKKILILNGPNLNLLGKREPEIYGHLNLAQIESHTAEKTVGMDVSLTWVQDNLEGELINQIQSKVIEGDFDCLILNPGGYTHTSVALLDCLKMVKKPVIEVHLTNTNAREEYRRKKITSEAANIIIEGAGVNSYYLAITSFLSLEDA